jgi:hypothetical protein
MLRIYDLAERIVQLMEALAYKHPKPRVRVKARVKQAAAEATLRPALLQMVKSAQAKYNAS